MTLFQALKKHTASWVVLTYKNEYVKVHRFPSDPDEKQRCINALVNILPKKSTQDMVVCIKY